MEKSNNPIFYQDFLVENHGQDSCIDTFCQNVIICKEKSGYSWKDISDAIDVPMETLRAVYKKDNNDYKIELVRKLAKFFGLTIDELAGANTISPNLMKAAQRIRGLDPTYEEFFCQLVRHIHQQIKDHKENERIVPLMTPLVDLKTGNLQYSLRNYTDVLELSSISDDIRPKIVIGIKIPCDTYQPIIWKGDTLLIAKDRNPRPQDICVMNINDSLWFCNVRYEFVGKERVAKMYSLTDGHYCGIADEEFALGYIADIIGVK